MKRAVLGLLLALGYAPAALAQSSELEALMDQSIVSTPSKEVEASTTAPATSTVITAEELRAHGLRSLSEAINYASLGMVTTTLEHAVEIGARGVLLTGDYGDHVLLLVDGVPLNEPWDGTAYFERGAGLPFELVDHIEVTLGPGSVMHGGQAMLGVINVVTKRARDYRGLRFIAEGDAAAPVFGDGGVHLSPLSGFGRGYRLAVGFGHSFELFGTPAELTFQIERYQQRGPNWQLPPQVYGDDAVTGEAKDFGPRTPKGQWGGLATHANFVDVPAAYARLRVGNLEATLRAGMYKRASPYMTSIVNVGDDFDDPDNHERDRWLELGLNYQRNLSPRVSLSARAYGLLNEYSWFTRRSAAEECPDDLASGCERKLIGRGSVLGTDARVAIRLPELRGSTMLGVDSKLRDARSDLRIEDRITHALSSFNNDYVQTDALIAPYLQQAFSPVRWFDANLGVRWDYDTRFGSKLSPRAALGLTPWHQGRFKAIYSEAFRGPNAFELNYADRNEQVASPHLSAESVRSFELSVEQRIGTHRLFFGVFRSTWSDMVTFRSLSEDEVQGAIEGGALTPATTEAYVYANLGTLKSFGYNAAYETTLNQKLHLGANLTAAQSRANPGDGSGDQPLTVGPSIFGNARISYQLGGALPTPALAAYFQGRRPADRAFDGGFAQKPYAPFDVQVRLTFTGHIPRAENLRYRLSATYDGASRGPYVVGPTQYAADESSRATLSPQRRLSAFAGLEYVIE